MKLQSKINFLSEFQLKVLKMKAKRQLMLNLNIQTSKWAERTTVISQNI
jgi:hypothetical protein